MKTSVLANRDRAVYNTLLGRFSTQNGDLKNVIRQDIVRLEAVITNNGQLKFDIKQTTVDSKNRPLQKGVQQNDLFVAIGVALFIDHRLAAKQGNAVLQTAPIPQAFPATAGTAADLMVVYNSKLNFQKDGYAYGQKFDTNKFLRITDAQAQTQVFTDSATPTFKTNVLLSGRDREKDFLPLDPNWEFWGNAENNLWIDIPTFDEIDIQADATYENVATLLFEGFTVVGAAQ